MNTMIHLQFEERMVAALVSQIANRNHSMYKLIFESGYENIFFIDVETGNWIEEDLGFTLLAQEVGKEIKKLSDPLFRVPKILTWHKQYSDGKLIQFGFYNFMKDAHKMYEIYNSNKKYMYTLADMNNDEWQILGSRNQMPQYTDPFLIQHIIKILPFYYTNV